MRGNNRVGEAEGQAGGDTLNAVRLLGAASLCAFGKRCGLDG